MKKSKYCICYYGSSYRLVMRSMPMPFEQCCSHLLRFGYFQNPVLPCVFLPIATTSLFSSEIVLAQIEKY